MLAAHGCGNRLAACEHYEREQRSHLSLQGLGQESVSGQLPAKTVKLEVALQEFTAIVQFPGLYKAIHQAFELIQIRFGDQRTSPLQRQRLQLDAQGIQRSNFL